MATLRSTLSATYGPTGRTIAADTHHELARTWATCNDPGSHDAYRRLLAELPSTPRVAGELRCLRARGVDEPGDMGPPPADRATVGRYNRMGESVLYLSDSEQGAIAELLAHDKEPPFRVQEFSLPTHRLRIADFRDPSLSSFVANVFWFAELSGVPEQRVPSDFSRFVGAAVSELFDAMFLPGVRGAGFTYANVVVFRPFAPHTHWKDWLVGDSRSCDYSPE